jgi:CRISPR-associated protein Csm3
MESIFQLRGRVFIQARIEAITGLHIGGSSEGMEIGGVDNAVIRDTITQRPYIPGSSLRGKMRSQLEKALGLPQNKKIGRDVRIHTCERAGDYNRDGGCPVCHIFGVPGEEETAGPTLLIVRDCFLTEGSAQKLDKAQTSAAYTEFKTEVAIDRVTSAATPRNLERVPAGAVFGPVEMVFSIYEATDIQRLMHVLNGLLLLEDDYLGGSGSRGSGKVCFRSIEVSARSSNNYSERREYGEFESVQDLANQFTDLKNWISNQLGE